MVKIETFKEIEGFSNYLVSNKGDIYSKKRNKKMKQAKVESTTTGIFYCYVSLIDDFGKRKTKSVHRLVACSFIKNENGKRCVNHKDGNPENNKVENLEWVTHSENTIHAFENNLHSGVLPVLKYSLEGVFLKEYKSIADASRDTGIDHGTIRSNVIGLTRKAKEFIFIKKSSNKINNKISKYSYKSNRINKIAKTNEKNEIIEVFETARKACDSINVDYRNFNKYLNKGKLYKGFYWNKI